MSATAEDRSLRIRKNLHNLCSNSSSPVVVTTCLVADSVITEHQGEEIKMLGTDYDKFERIYTLVQKKLSLPNTYPSLMNALKKAGLLHIVQILADGDSVDRNFQNHVIGQIKKPYDEILADLKNNYTEWMKRDPRNLSSVDSFTRAHNQAHDNCFKTLRDIPADNKNKLKDDLTIFLKAECTTRAQKFMQEKQQQLVKDYKRRMNTFLASNQSRFEGTRIDDAHNNEIQLIKNEYDKFLNALPACLEKKSLNFTSETKGHLVSIKDQNNRRPQGAVLGGVAPTETPNGSAGNTEKPNCVMV